MDSRRLKVAVVGHVEWIRFARVAHVPAPGEVVHAEDPFDEPAGGGAVAAVQLARLAGRATLVTALGDDHLAGRAIERLGELGVEVWAARRREPTRTGVALLDRAGERTITTFGPRLQAQGDDEGIPWDALAEMDAVYFTAGDRRALEAARRARVLAASSRSREALGHGVPLDALLFSGRDPLERRAADEVRGQVDLEVSTAGADGGSYRTGAGERGSWAGVPIPGDPQDSYGCGDSFAAGVTYGLAARLPITDALALGARCGASCRAGRGPYGRQLTRSEL
jgi:ribokinase